MSSNIVNEKVIGTSQLQEYNKQREAHLPVELNQLKDALICTFNIISTDQTIRMSVSGATEINWGDGTIDDKTYHTYTKAGQYICVVKGNDMELATEAFRDNASLTKIIIGNNVKSIGAIAFRACQNLEYVEIGCGISDIQATGIFMASTALKTVILPDTLLSISDRMFLNCYALETIRIGKNIANISEGAFSGCIALKSVEIPAELPPTLAKVGGIFPETLEKIIVPIESIDSYKNATNWSYFADKIVGIVDSNYLENRVVKKMTGLNAEFFTSLY